MRLKAKWAIDSEAMRVRGIILFLVKSDKLVKKSIEKKYLVLVKARQNLIQSPLFWLLKLLLFPTSAQYNIKL